MDDSSFLVVGAGIAGLAASLGLARCGKPSVILERTSRFETVGAGLQLGPNAVRALQMIGAWDAVEPHCVSPAEIHIRDAITGKHLQRIILGKLFETRFGSPYHVLHRAQLQAGLLECVQAKSDIRIQTGAEVVDVSTTIASLTLQSGENLRGPAIIAADGVHSVVRQKMQPHSAARFTGHTVFRALMPISTVPSSIDANVVTLWLYPGGHVVHYMVSNGRELNIVASMEAPKVAPSVKFKGTCSLLTDLLAVQDKWLEWPAYVIPPDPAWNKDRVLLIGDAAHPSLPYLAQGAAMALEDACVLAKILAGSEDIPGQLRAFTSQRFERTSKIQVKSTQAGKIYHVGIFLRQLRNLALTSLSPERFMDRLAWVYDWSDRQH